MGIIRFVRLSKPSPWLGVCFWHDGTSAELERMSEQAAAVATQKRMPHRANGWLERGPLARTPIFIITLLLGAFSDGSVERLQAWILNGSADGTFPSENASCFGQEPEFPYSRSTASQPATTPLGSNPLANNQFGTPQLGNSAPAAEPLFPSYSQAQELRGDSTLRAVAFGTQNLGVACGDRGVILRTEDGGESWQSIETEHQCTLADITWISSQDAVIVGGSLDRVTGISRGIVLWTRDGGLNWSNTEDAELPMLRHVAWNEDRLIATGDWSDSLLTTCFESYDRGRSWHAAIDNEGGIERGENSRTDLLRWRVATNQQITVRDACRTSELGRCLVGDHGVIALTADQGKSWQVVRGQQRKTGVLFISRHPASVAWSLVGREALEERHRVNLLCESLSEHADDRLTTQTTASHAAKTIQQQKRLQLARQAALACGAAGLDEMQINPQIDLNSLAKQWVAILEPTVLVFDQSLEPALKDAFLSAGISRKVKRVIEYSYCNPDSGARQGTLVHKNAMLSRVGILASDLHSDAMHWVAPHHADGESIQTVTLYDVATAGASGDSLMNGLAVKPSENLAAEPPQSSRRKIQVARARIKRESQLEELITKTPSSDQFQSLLEQLIKSTSKDDQFRLVWQMIHKTSNRVADLPSLERYEITLESCVRWFPQWSAGRWAESKLESVRNSVEWQTLTSLLPERPKKAPTHFGVPDLIVSPFQQIDSSVQTASATSPIHSPVSPVVVPRLATESVEQKPKSYSQNSVDLQWEFHPLVLISREASRLRSDSGELEVATKESPNLARLADSSHPWSALARAEGAKTVLANSSEKRPTLDGNLTDDCWKHAITLHSGTTLRVAYDNDYVYLGVTVPNQQLQSPLTEQIAAKISQGNQSESERSEHGQSGSGSPRDQSLLSQNRLRIGIDIDQDLLSQMELQVTAAGKVHDAIDGCENWQPTWYPAIQSNDVSTTFEIAILRRDLTTLPITHSETWLVSVSCLNAGQKNAAEMIPNPDRLIRVLFE